MQESSPKCYAGAAIYDDDFKETTVIVVATGDGKMDCRWWSGTGSNKCGLQLQFVLLHQVHILSCKIR